MSSEIVEVFISRGILFCVLPTFHKLAVLQVIALGFDYTEVLQRTCKVSSLPSPDGVVVSQENLWLKPSEVPSLGGHFLLSINMLLQCWTVIYSFSVSITL